MNSLKVIPESFIPETGISTQIVKSVYQKIITHPVFIHTHEFYEIVYIASGEISHALNFNERPTKTGDCYFIKPGQVHYFKNSLGCEHRDILIKKEIMEQIFALVPEAENAINSCGQFAVLPLQKLREYEQELAEFTTTENLYKKKLLGIKTVADILSNFFINSNSKSDNHSNTPPLLIKILDCFTQNEYIKKGISKIIEDLKYDPSYLGRLFKAHTGITLSEHLKEVRLNYVEYYLSSTNLTLTEICDKVGLESTSYLNRIFKQKYKLSPIRYRKTYKNMAIPSDYK